MTDLQRFRETASGYDLPEPSYDADLVIVDRGTPMGEMLRRYWHPVHKSEKLTDLPVKVKALGDEIILFRKPDGAVGAVYPRCIHRGTDLIWGKVVDRGIRCCYHGWTFDTDGTCKSQPCEPNDGGKGKNAVRQPWYPAEELYGFIWVYLGPLDKKPALPRYDNLENLPEGWEVISDDTSIPSGGAGHMPCNWLQHHENGMDPAHVPIVHEHQFPPMMAQAKTETYFFKDADRVRGNGISKIGPMMMDFKVEISLPITRIIPDPLLEYPRPDGKCDSVSWTLPIDNENTIIFTALTRPIGAKPNTGELYNGKRWTELSFEEHQRFPGDFEAQTGQGRITLHSEEHLVSSDKGVVYLRRLLESAVRDVQEGRDPPLSFGSDSILIETWSGMQMMPNSDYVDTEATGDKPATPTNNAAPPAGVAGKWLLTMNTPMGDQTIVIEFAQDGGALAGVMFSPEGDDSAPLKDASVNDGALQWSADVKKPFPMTIKFDVALDGDALSGTFKPGIFPAGKVSGVRG